MRDMQGRGITSPRCTFIPQAWTESDSIYPADPLGPTVWIIPDWEGDLPEPYSYASDALRGHPSTPDWCRGWDGPFEVDYEEVAE